MQSAPIAILVMGGLLAVIFIVNLATGAGADYAGLVPAPDSILWEEGDETTLWLNTNLSDVELRIATVDLGLGAYRRVVQETGQTLDLGRSEGCLGWAVSALEVYQIDDATGVSGRNIYVQGNIDRGAFTGSATVYVRVYPKGADLHGLTSKDAPFENVDADGTIFSFDAGTGDSFSGRRYTVPETDGEWIAEASHSTRFTPTSRVAVSGNVSADSWTRVEAEAEDVVLPSDVGIGLIACSEADDVLVTLHNDEGKELKRYMVDILADPLVRTPTPQTAPAGIESFDIRVCLDSADHRANYLDGWEYAGVPLDAERFGFRSGDLLDGATLEDAPGNEFVYFFAVEVVSGQAQIRVTPAGASNTSGLDIDRVYPIALKGKRGASEGPTILWLGIWLDQSTLSPNDNGLCS